jgi:hypothetical protein
VLTELGRRTPGDGGLVVEAHGGGHQLERMPVAGRDGGQEPVRLDLGMVRDLGWAQDRGPHPAEPVESLVHLFHRFRPEHRIERADALSAIGVAGGAVNEALVLDELWTTQKRAQLAPEAIGLEADQVEPTAIAGAVGVDDRVG